VSAGVDAAAGPGGRDAWLQLPDGVRLVSRLWTPAGKGPWPVLLMRQPYGRAIASTVTYAHPRWYADRGFAVVVQDVRGRGDSDGDFSGFAQEPEDGSRTLAWVRQQPWCNGRIGSYGFSYQGLTQLLLADPEQLPDALAPALCGLDERAHWACSGGAPWWALGLAWGLQLAAQGCQRRGEGAAWRAIRSSLSSGAFLEEGLELLRRHDPEGMGLGWLQADPTRPEPWLRHQPPPALWRRPMLLIGGWHDPHLAGVLELWQRADQAGGSPMLRIGPWSHLQWQGGIDALQLDFFNRHLKGPSAGPTAGANPAPPGAPPAIQLQASTGGPWQAADPRRSSGQRWGLASTGLAAVDSQEGRLLEPGSAPGPSTPGEGTVLLVHDPWRPLPGRGGHLGLDAGAVERGDLDLRTDVACFNGTAATAALELLGQPQLQITAAADQPGFDLCAALSVVGADGSVLQVSTGVARFLGESCLEPQRRLVVLQPLLLHLRPGERLRLSLGLAAWPQIAVNSGDGSQPLGGSGPNHRTISVALQLADAELSMRPLVGAN
jgi:putative CocE/NonD family hydrolase